MSSKEQKIRLFEEVPVPKAVATLSIPTVLSSLVALLYSLAEYYENCYVIDMFNYAPVFDEAFKERYFMYGHMNPMGYIFIAKMVDSYIDYIIRHNSADFKNAGFINSGIKY